MSFYLQVLSTEGIDSSACIAVFTESHRFLFNCGEGIQRLCVEHKVRLSKIRAVMFTDFSPQDMFGLPGLSLTAADAGNNNIRVAGPTQLKPFLYTTRHFMKLPDGLLNFHTTTEQSSCIFNSSEVDLRMISFDCYGADGYGSSQCSCFVGRTPELKGKFDLQKAQTLNVPKGPLFGKLKNGQSITLADGTVIHPDQVLGESELSKYFIVVCSVLAHEEELLMQITQNAVLNRFQAGQVDSQTGGALHCIVHLSPAATVNSPLYKAWIDSFGSAVTHIYTGAGTSATTHSSFIATTTTCNKMHLTTPDLFPTMHNVYAGLYDSLFAVDDETTNHVAAVPLLKFHLLPVRNQGVEFPTPVDCSALAQALYKEVTNESAENATKVKAALTQMEVVKDVLTTQSIVDSTPTLKDTSVESPSIAHVAEGIQSLYGVTTAAASQLLHSGLEGKISFLGTGCSIPSKYRNVSGILLQLNNSGDISNDSASRGDIKGLLIDAGEGTWAQMQRLLYEAALKEHNATSTKSSHSTTTLPTLLDIQYTLASQLRVIWVSHPHADHHLGLVRVIIERKTALLTYSFKNSSAISHSEVEALIVIAPPSVLAFLHEYSLLNPTMQDAYIGVSCRAYDPDDSCVYTDCYWNKTLIEAIDSNNNSEAADEQDHKRKRTHSPDKLNPVSTTIDSTTSTTVVTDSSAVTTKPDDIPHKKHVHGESSSAHQPKKSTKGYQYFIDTGSAHTEDTVTESAAAVVGGNTLISDMLTDTTNSTICGMNEVNNNISTSAVITTTAATSGNKTWRNFKHIFKEQIPTEVLALASEAKLKADRVLQQIGIVELTNVQVVHCGQSYGLSITIVPASESNTCSSISDVPTIANPTTVKPIKLVYSGDTRPCPRLIVIGADATILIHEATFEDTKQEEAVMKRHSTMSEAYQVGVEMKAFRTIFTHFSQRYPGVPLLAKFAVDNATTIATSDASAESISDAADSMTTDVNGAAVVETIDPILAFDYMQLSFKDLLWAPASTAVYSAAFPGKTTVSKGGEADEE